MMFKHSICVAIMAAGLFTALPAHASVQFGAHAGPASVGVLNEVNVHTAPMAQTRAQWVQRQISARDAKSIAERRVPNAKVVDVTRNGDTYRVRLIRKDGRVVDVYVDANTGRVRN